jgi:hypothetical protein
MRLTAQPCHDHIRATRREAYLTAWPAHAQLEAHAEAAAGRPEKLNQMLADLAEIRAANPIPGGTDAV